MAEGLGESQPLDSTVELWGRRGVRLGEDSNRDDPGYRVLTAVVAYLTGDVWWEEGGVAVAQRELGPGRNRLRLRRHRRAGSHSPRHCHI